MNYVKRGVFVTSFRRLPFGVAYWLKSNTATTPRIKAGRTSYLSGWNTGTGVQTLTTEPDTSVKVVKVPKAFSGLWG